jgi:hypothetical protein
METVAVHQFHWAQTQLDSFLEMAIADKQNCRLWGARCTYIIRAYHELMLTYVVCPVIGNVWDTVMYSIQDMGASVNAHVRRAADEIKQKLFYQIEYRDLCVQLLRKYNSVCCDGSP